MKKFYEIDVTKFRKVRLIKIYSILHGPHRWGKDIDNLEMIVDEKDRIIVRGWATKRCWEKFCKLVIDDDRLDYVYYKTNYEEA